MNLLYFVPVLAVLCLVPIGFISAQTEPIPSWIRNNAGLWADRLIDDETFLAGIEFLIDNGIITVNQQDENNNDILKLEKIIERNNRHIQDLEATIKEKDELIQELQSEVDDKDNHIQEQEVTTNEPQHTLNSNTQTNTNSDNSEDATESIWKKGGYVTTDRQTYAAGDTIHITGNTDASQLPERKNAKGETVHPENHELVLRVMIEDGLMGIGVRAHCQGQVNTIIDECLISNPIQGVHITDGLDPLRLIKYDSNGTFAFETRVGDNTEVNDYVVMINYRVDNYINVNHESSHFSIVPSN